MTTLLDDVKDLATQIDAVYEEYRVRREELQAKARRLYERYVEAIHQVDALDDRVANELDAKVPGWREFTREMGGR